MSTSDGDVEQSDAFVNLVDFKWLMAGVGWWVDLSRLQSDIGYFNDCLQRALRSDSDLLRDRSLQLLGLQHRTNALLGGPEAHNPNGSACDRPGDPLQTSLLVPRLDAGESNQDPIATREHKFLDEPARRMNKPLGIPKANLKR